MMERIVLWLSVLLAVATATFGQQVQWPAAFSSLLDVKRTADHRAFVARWFYDSFQQAERFDSSGKYGWDVDIRRYDTGKRYTIVHWGENNLRCTATNLIGAIPTKDLTGFVFKDYSLMNNRKVGEWISPTQDSAMQYFVDPMNSQPVQIITKGAVDETIEFLEFEEGTQDLNMFSPDFVAPGVTCVQEEEVGFVRMSFIDNPDQQQWKYYTTPTMPQSNGTSGCESGEASWYSCSGRGACAACSPTEYMAAHKTLPCGCPVTVTNTRNGKNVAVRIEDRGPYVAGRIVDMNRAPANDLDMISAGVVPARVCWTC